MQHGKASEKLTITGFALRVPARLSGAPLPVRKLVLPWGVNSAIDGPVVLDSTSAQAFSAIQKARGWDRVALDYEHNTLPGSPAYKETQEPRDVAAFGVPELVPGEGIYLNALEWTPGGTKAAPNFCDLSPALVFAKGTRTVVGMHSVALTRAGAIDGVRAFSVSLADIPSTQTEDKTMDPSAILRALLGLPDTATPADMLTAAQALGSTLKTLAANSDTLVGMSAQAAELKAGLDTLKGLDIPAVKEKIVAFSAINTAAKEGIEGLALRMKSVEDKVVAFDAGRAAAERQAIIEQAKREGKVLPFSAEALKTVSLDTLREVASKTPVTVPMGQRTVETQAVEAFDAGSRGDPSTASAVAKAFGRKPEDLSKAGL